MRWFIGKPVLRAAFRNSAFWDLWDGAESIGEFIGWLIIVIILVSVFILLFLWIKELIYRRTPEYKQKVKEYEMECERRKKREEEIKEIRAYKKRMDDNLREFYGLK